MNISRAKITTFFASIFVVFMSVYYFSLNVYSAEELSAANSLAQRGVIVDHSDNPGSYNLGKSVLRQEIAAVVYEIAGLQKKSSCENNFSDVSSDKPNSWACGVIEALYDAGLIAKNTKFNPEAKITKSEALGMIVSAGYADKYSYDSSLSSSWQEQLINFAKNNGISEFFSDYNSEAKRGWIFINAENVLKKDSAPLVKNTSFIEEAQILTSKKTNIIFSSAMDKVSVEENIKIYPEIKTKLTWISDSELEVAVDEKLENDTDIIINILDTAIDSDGNKLEKTIVKKFKTGGIARLDFISPEGAITDLTKNITVRFSKPMVSLTALDNQGACPIKITPSLPGKCVWITTSTVQFRPDKGFPVGASYNVVVDSGLKTIAGDKTVSGANIKITTPQFKVFTNNATFYLDKPIVISFNSEVLLDNFKDNFRLSGFDNSNLNIEYLKTPSSIEGEFEISKSRISIFPKSGDWGYSKKYTYTLGAGLKSARGNISLGTSKKVSFSTQSLLISYSPFVYMDLEVEDINHISNFRQSNDKNRITKIKPNIVFNFYEEVELDKSLFNLGGANFSLSYPKQTQYIDGKSIIKENKKSIVLNIADNISGSLELKVYLFKINKNTKDAVLNFKTKDDNNLLDYKFINYKKSCVDFRYDMGYNLDTTKFDFGEDKNVVSYASKVQSYSRDEDCKYIPGVNRYILTTRLNPDSDYNLDIHKDLLDRDNYPLNQNYKTSFKTGKALNEDKIVSIVDARNLILIPTNIKPLGVAIQTVNLDKVNIEVCEGDFDIEDSDYIKEANCINKEVAIKDLKFKTNFSVLNLEEIYGKDFSKSLITLRVEKLDEDKSSYENQANRYSSIKNKVHYLRTDKSLVLKSSKEGLLWLSDFKTGENLTNAISKVELYKKEGKYDSYGKYSHTNTYKSSVSFRSLDNGLYKLESDTKGLLLITLNSGESLLLDNNNYYLQSLQDKIYLTTDRPIYTPGDTVRIKGVGRRENARGYTILSGTNKLNIVNPKWKNILSKDLVFSDNGTITYDFVLDKDISLGNYNISLASGNISFSVEEYEKPDFKVESNPIKESYLYSQRPQVLVSAKYYIGGALSGANGKYNIVASDYNFDGGKTKGYTWGENTSFWDFRYDSFPRNNSSFVSNGEFSLDSKGKAILEIDTSKTVKDKIYNISSSVIDPNTKKLVSSTNSFKLLNSDVFVGLKTNSYYYSYGDIAKLDFVTVDKLGNKLANKPIKFSVYKLDYKYNKTSYNYENSEKLLYEKSLVSNTSGTSRVSYKIEDYGQYRFEIKTSDGKYITTKTMYVSGANIVRPIEQEHSLGVVSNKDIYKVGEKAEFVIASPVVGVKALVTVEKLDKVLYKKVININSTSQKIILNIDKDYLPNFDLKVFLIKPVSSSSNILEKLKQIRLEMLDIENQINLDEEIIIRPIYILYDLLSYDSRISYYNDTSLSNKPLLDKLSILRTKEQSLMQQILPGYYTATIPVKVSLDTIKLSSSIKTDKQDYLPGDSSKIELNILDSNGNPISGEAVISIVDESLLSLKDNSIDIVDFFYSDKRNNIFTSFNMKDLIKRLEFNNQDELKTSRNSFQELGGGGELFADSVSEDKASSLGFAQSKLAGAPSNNSININSTRLRTNFKDSAYYKAVVKVVNGKAIVDVPKLPDNLTTWVIKGYTVTKDTKVGNFESKFKVRKDLNLLPSLPRFFVSGDEFEITATAINNTSRDLNIKATLDITNASIISSPGVLTVEANSQKLITWKVKIDAMKPLIDWDSFSSDIIIKVTSGNLVDSLKLTRKIIPYSTPEYSFTNGSTYALSYEEVINLPNYVDKTQGQIDITLGATILTNLLDSIDSIASMPFDNFYSTVSALKKGAVLKGLYTKAGRLDEFKQITVVDYNGDTHILDDIINSRLKDIKNYQNTDGGMMSYVDCIPSGWMKTCSNFSLTGDFLSMARELKTSGYSVDSSVVDKALTYYKTELESSIRDYESKNNSKYRNIEPFYKILGYDKDFINKYLLSDRFSSDYKFDNISKLKIVLLLQNTSPSSSDISKYISEFKNNTLIEARGSLFPSGNWGANNINSTALALKVFIKDLEGEKLIIENLARWLMAQKREDGNFGNSLDSSEVIKTITDYIIYTKELENVDFDASGFLNSKEIIKTSFDDKTKFDLTKQSFSLKDYLSFGEDNSLGFEKSGDGKLYYDVGLKYFLPIDKIAPREEGIIVSRNYYNYDEYKNAYKQECYYWNCTKVQTKSLSSVSYGNKGDLLVGEIEIIVPSERNNVVVNDFIPAGAEIVNTNLDTTSNEVKSLTNDQVGYGGDTIQYRGVSNSISPDYRGDDNSIYYGGGGFNHIEIRDSKLDLFADHLSKGTYKYTYVIALNNSGIYHHRPAFAYELKKPEIWGRTRGEYFIIK